MASGLLFAIAVVLLSSRVHCQPSTYVGLGFQLRLTASRDSEASDRYNAFIARLTISDGVTLPSVLMNAPDSRTIPIPAASMVLYMGNSRQVNAGVGVFQAPSGYQYVFRNASGFFAQEFTTGDNTGDSGPGVLYPDGQRVLFSTDASFNRLYDQLLQQLPRQLSLMFNLRNGPLLIMNAQSFPGNDADGDVMELNGNMAIEIERRETLLYQDQTITYRRGSVTQGRFDNIASFYELRENELRRFIDSSPNMIFSGPGVLRIGRFQGAMVAVFGTSNARNLEITTATVDNQLTFDVEPDMNSAVINDIFTNRDAGGPVIRLIELSGAKMFSFPTARRVTYNMGLIRIFDASGRQLGTFRNQIGFSGFINNEILNYNVGLSNREFLVSEGGCILFKNVADLSNPMAGMFVSFAYPTRNTVIRDNIANALSQIRPPRVTIASFSARTTPDGGAIFRANGEDIVTITDNPPIVVQGGQFVNYDGTEVTIYDGADPNTAIFDTPIMINMLAFDAPGFNYSMFNSTFVPSGDFTGPGVLYYDALGRGIYTKRQSTINFIDGFISNLAPPRITTMIRIVNGMLTNIVDVGNAGRQLVEVSSMTNIEMPTSTQGVLYTGRTVRMVNGFNVPGNARVVTTDIGGIRQVRVLSLTNEDLFPIPYSLLYFYYYFILSSYRERQGGTVTVFTGNNTSPGGGVLYFDPTTMNVLYERDGDVSDMLITALAGAGVGGITFPSVTPNIDELNFFDGRRVFQFMGSAPMFLGGPGTLFTTRNQSYYSQDVGSNIRLTNEIVRLLPVTLGGDITTGEVSVTSGTGVSVYNFTIGRTTVVNVGAGRVGTYTGGNVTIGNRIIRTDRFVVFNGLERKEYGPTDMVTFSGSGRITILEDGTVVFNSDRSSISRIDEFVRRFPNAPPLIAPPGGDIRSPNSPTRARFGQDVTVYNGTIVELECRDIRGVPQSELVLLRNGIPINSTTDEELIVEDESGSAVTFTFVARSNDTYTCRATNDFGLDERNTVLTTLTSDRPAMVINTFKPFVRNLTGRVITAQMPTNNEPIIIPGAQSMGGPIYSDSFLFDGIVNVACKIDTLPTSTLEFMANIVGDINRVVNGTTLTLGPGRAIYTINVTDFFLNSPGLGDIEVNCMGIGQMEVNAQVILMVQSIVCESFTPGECSATCGIGIQQLFPSDCRRSTSAPLPETITRPPPGLYRTEFDICSAPTTCPPVITFEFENSEDEFEECNRTCGTGRQLSRLICYQLVDGMREEVVGNGNCTDAGAVVPLRILRDCAFDRCPVWEVTDYGPCSSTCRGGTQDRTAFCTQRVFIYNETTGERLCSEPDANNNTEFLMNDTVVPDAMCANAGMRPSEVRRCNHQVLCPHRWFPEPWGPCARDFCQERGLTCVRFEVTDPGERWVLNDTECADIPRPHVVRSCGGGVCSRGVWRVSSESPCSVTCGVGLTQREVQCFLRSGNQAVDPGYCNYRMRPADQNRCILFNCPGRCDFEPNICRIYAMFRMCKDNPAGVGQCCRSCPLQSAPIVLPPLITPQNMVVALTGPMSIMAGINPMFCCDATGRGENPANPAFLPFTAQCIFDVEFADGRDPVEETVNVGRRLNDQEEIENQACVTVSTTDLERGDTFEVTLRDLNLFDGTMIGIEGMATRNVSVT